MIRPVTTGELCLLARVLVPAPEQDRPGLAAGILAETQIAAEYLDRHGRPHPQLGDGSIAARCLRLFPPSESFCDPQFLRALQLACAALVRHLET
ncbi:hypothetical protein [Tabrizicola sp.]|uniref:DUF7742 family protein n=1 Tax=Tabrizicola sp. TaxID=2005166 RepID=UPI0035B43AD2